jgi:hypothetical protein
LIPELNQPESYQIQRASNSKALTAPSLFVSAGKIRVHVETFGPEVLGDASSALEVFIAEKGIAV